MVQDSSTSLENQGASRTLPDCGPMARGRSALPEGARPERPERPEVPAKSPEGVWPPKLPQNCDRAGRGQPRSHCLVPWAEWSGCTPPVTAAKTSSRLFPEERGHADRGGQRFRQSLQEARALKNFPRPAAALAALAAIA